MRGAERHVVFVEHAVYLYGRAGPVARVMPVRRTETLGRLLDGQFAEARKYWSL